MANIFNDLNKLVNTVQKVDRLLTEKPKSTTPTKSIPLTLEERKYIRKLLEHADYKQFGNTDKYTPIIETLLNKIK